MNVTYRVREYKKIVIGGVVGPSRVFPYHTSTKETVSRICEGTLIFNLEYIIGVSWIVSRTMRHLRVIYGHLTTLGS